ncbi:MAG: asparaginase [Chloroflexi bacterium]|nr:asparaginase [Chloroflexota bacterium]
MTTSVIVADGEKARVFILYTGGTIGMAPEDLENPDSPLVAKPLDELLQYVPGLANEGITLGFASFDEPLDSTEVMADHWLKMAAEIEQVYEEYDGFVILHGTDTMAYTTSGLSFIMENLAKPVVVTGSQLPISSARTDAVQNFVASVFLAGYKATNLPLIPEVMLCFADRVLRGNRARKISTASWVGFDSPNFPLLATIGEHIVVNRDLIRAPADNTRSKFFVHRQLVTDALAIDIFPGLRPSHLAALLDQEDIRAVVLKTFGVGNCPAALWPTLSAAIEGKGGRTPKVVVNVTQCLQGSVEMGLYAASSGLLEGGVLSGLDMTPEAALVKLFWALGTIRDPQERNVQLQIDQRGEQSENLFDLRFIPAGQTVEPKEVHDFTQSVDGRFLVERLTKAVIRLSGVACPEAEPGQMVTIKAYLNLPPVVAPDSPEAQRYLAVELSDTYDPDAGLFFIQDISPIVEEVVRPGPPITISLVASTPIQPRGVFLALFARV